VRVLLTKEQRRANRSASHAKWMAKTATPERSEANAIYQREYRLKNAEILKDKKAEKYQRTKGMVIAKVTEWAKANKHKTRESVRKWTRNNKAKVNAAWSARNAAKCSATPFWAEFDLIEKVYGKANEFGMHVDHIVPLQSELVCGLHVWANLQLLAPFDNISKGNRYWPDMPI